MTSLLSVLFGADFARNVRAARPPKTATVGHGKVERFERFGRVRNKGEVVLSHDRDADTAARARWTQSLAADFGLGQASPSVTLELSTAKAGTMAVGSERADRVLVLLEGRERWRVHGPTKGQTILLREGSALFLPRSLEASREALSATRSALFRLAPPTWLDIVLDRVSHALVQDPRWRRPLPPSFGPRRDDAIRALNRLLGNLDSTLGPFDAAELCEFYQARRAAFGSNPSGAARCFMLAKGSKLKRISQSQTKAPATEPWLLISPARRVELDVDRATVPLFAWIAAHPHPMRFSMTEALQNGGQLTFEEVITLLELLTRHKVLRLEQLS